jgi:glycosyltransferase involved in cell wall biosynthesis
VPKQIKISVVICTYNRCESLKQCLTSVVKQTYQDFEVLIIDDHSDDNTQNLIKDYQAAVENIYNYRNEKNMGLSFSRNKGAELASNELIVFIDDDCIANEDWLLEIIKPFNDFKVGLVFGGIKDPQPKNLSMVAAKGHYKRFSKEGLCDSVPSGGGNMAVRKDFYLNKPIRDFTLEDWELSQNALDTGYLIYYKPNAIVVHEHYHNLKTLLRQRYRYGVGHTWFRKRNRLFPLNLPTLLLVLALCSLPLIGIWNVLLPIEFIIFIILLGYLFVKDFRKGEKSIRQAIISFPVFLLIALSECYGRLVGLFKTPTQINFGTDRLKKILYNF